VILGDTVPMFKTVVPTWSAEVIYDEDTETDVIDVTKLADSLTLSSIDEHATDIDEPAIILSQLAEDKVGTAFLFRRCLKSFVNDCGSKWSSQT
jgi:hypothetical protein